MSQSMKKKPFLPLPDPLPISPNTFLPSLSLSPFLFPSSLSSDIKQ